MPATHRQPAAKPAPPSSPVIIRAGHFAFSSLTEQLGAPGERTRWMFGFPLDEEFQYGERKLLISSEVAVPALEAQFGAGPDRYLPSVKDNHESGSASAGRLVRWVIVTREQLAARGIPMRYGRAVLFAAELLPHKQAEYDAGALRFSSPEIRLNYRDDQRSRALFVGECSFVDLPHFKGQPPLDELRGLTFSEYRAAEGGTVNEEQIKAMMAELEALKAENARLKTELDGMKAGGTARTEPTQTMTTRESGDSPEAVILKLQEQRIRALELDHAKQAVVAAFQERNHKATDEQVMMFAELKLSDAKRYDLLMSMVPAQQRPVGQRVAGNAAGGGRDNGESMTFSELGPREKRAAVDAYIEKHKLTGADAYDRAYIALARTEQDARN